MHASEMAEKFPVVNLDSDALEAVKLLAKKRLPGLVLTDDEGHPKTILPGSQVVRMLVPSYVQDDPQLAGVMNETLADRVADKLEGNKVRNLLPEEMPELAVVKSDDTILEVAAVMARLRCPLAAVMEGEDLIGVITATRLLDFALRGH